jgi:multiple antibiotic resistance protein
MLAGPGSILLLHFIVNINKHPKLYSRFSHDSQLSIFFTLRSAHYLAKILGASGIVAIPSRRFYQIAIGVQYIISSI